MTIESGKCIISSADWIHGSDEELMIMEQDFFLMKSKELVEHLNWLISYQALNFEFR